MNSNIIQISEQTLGGRKLKVGSSSPWDAIMEWFRTGKVAPMLDMIADELTMPRIAPFNPQLKGQDNICVLPTRGGILLYVPSESDRMATKITVGIDGKEKKVPNYEAEDVGIPKKKENGGLTLCEQIPWSTTSLRTIVNILPKLIVNTEEQFQSWDSTTISGMTAGKVILKQYFDVQLNFLPRLCQFACACVYLSEFFEYFEHSILRYINGQFSANELIRCRRSDNPEVKAILTSIKEGGTIRVKNLLYKVKTTTAGHVVITTLADDFTMSLENKQGCAIKLMGERISRIALGDDDLESFMEAEKATAQALRNTNAAVSNGQGFNNGSKFNLPTK